MTLARSSRLSLLVVNRSSGTGGGPLRIARIESSSVLAVLAVFEHHRFAFALFVPDGFLSRGVRLRVEERAVSRGRSIYYARAIATHLGGPLSRLPRFKPWFAVHGVDHLQRDPRGLVQEKVGKDGGGEVATGKDETVAIVDLSSDEGGEEGLRGEAPGESGVRR